MNTLILGVLAAITSAFSWAASTILIKVGMRNKSPVAVNIFRLYAVSIMFAVIFLINGTFSQIAVLPPELLLVAFVSAQFGFVVGDYFYFNALKLMGVSRTVPITSTYPLWTILWASLFLGRKISPQVIVGAILVVVAIIVVRKAEEEEHINLRGFVFALLAPVSWSFAILTMDWLTQSIDVLSLAGIRMVFAAIGISLFLPRYGKELREITQKEAIVLIGAAISGLMLGQYFFVYSVNLVGSQIAAPVSAINPIIASAMAILLLKEPPNKKILEGLILAVLGVILISTA
ncbi:DMT family transporter [Thermococcus sp. GR7]|uniref:DMT family transporter n=1 Tax=unclassified Thermococcus TaxID=2627626 RepID=UPI001431FAE9|nr:MULTISPECIES: DMT family transporter [unclassified Thermococcus]NJE46535.1 DMT family transporter [Thermococcus sp. GR7]NJE77545.1 DMT family transporter [Thermococcus sp. GR4]NJF23634.1 DMT family transporter [Thermococcus sp. GR5]